MKTKWISVQVTVEAVLVGNNLAVHKSVGQIGYGNGEEGYVTPYAVTHIQSGRAVWPADSMEEGIQVAGMIDDMFDDVPTDIGGAEYQSWLKGVIPAMRRRLGIDK